MCPVGRPTWRGWKVIFKSSKPGSTPPITTRPTRIYSTHHARNIPRTRRSPPGLAERSARTSNVAPRLPQVRIRRAFQAGFRRGQCRGASLAAPSRSHRHAGSRGHDGSKERGERFSMFALRTCANIVSFLLVTKNEIGAERVPVCEASEKCSAPLTPQARRRRSNAAEDFTPTSQERSQPYPTGRGGRYQQGQRCPTYLPPACVSIFY